MNRRDSGFCPQMRPKPLGIGDCLTLAGLLLFAFWFLYAVAPAFPYDWNWGAIPQFLAVRTSQGWEPGVLGKGLLLTIRLGFWSSLGALVVGFVWALGRAGGNRYISLLARTAIESCRNLPPLVLVFVFYYFLSSQLLPWEDILAWLRELPQPVQTILAWLLVPVDHMDIFLPAVVTLSLYEGAYMAEIFRGGLESIPKGQWEASYCLGLSPLQQYRYVIGPQVLRNVSPQLAGQFISTVKDSAIVSVIGMEELTYSGLQLMATIKQPFEVWLTVAALYLLLSLGISLCLGRKENSG